MPSRRVTVIDETRPAEIEATIDATTMRLSPDALAAALDWCKFSSRMRHPFSPKRCHGLRPAPLSRVTYAGMDRLGRPFQRGEGS